MTTDPDICHNGLLRQAMRRVTKFYDRRLATSGLKSTQLIVLMHVDFLREPTLKTLAHRLIMDLSALGHSLKPLERDGLIELVPDPEDGRARRVRLTSSGKDRFGKAIIQWHKAQNDLKIIIGEKKAEELRGLLRVLVTEDFERALQEIDTVT